MEGVFRGSQLSNDISAKIAKQQFLMRESERLEEDIQRLKSSDNYDQNLFNNMVNKKSRYMKDAHRLADDILNSSSSG
ncbi:MAG: hypothetical protein AB1713_07240 [Pseudomonadota bacterium]